MFAAMQRWGTLVASTHSCRRQGSHRQVLARLAGVAGSRLYGRGRLKLNLTLAMQLETNWESVVLQLACEWDAVFWRAGPLFLDSVVCCICADCQHIHQAARAGAIWSMNLGPLAHGDKKTDGPCLGDWLRRTAVQVCRCDGASGAGR
jgi:hypothetical protein